MTLRKCRSGNLAVILIEISALWTGFKPSTKRTESS